jgi:hypothetical protein
MKAVAAAFLLAGCGGESGPVALGTGRFGLGMSVLLAAVALIVLFGLAAWRLKVLRSSRGKEPRGREADGEALEALREDPRFLVMRRRIEETHKASFDDPGDFLTYRICRLAVHDAEGKAVAPEDPDARVLVAYLLRKVQPARLRIEMNVRTGEMKETALEKPHWEECVGKGS